MIEKVKTFILTTLVLLSMYLTWQLWTFQPDYDYLPETEFVPSEGIAEEREIEELIRPLKIVHHLEGAQYRVSYPGGSAYEEVDELLAEWEFYHFHHVDPELYAEYMEQLSHSTGLEIIFRSHLPIEGLSQRIDMLDNVEELPAFNRIVLFEESVGAEVAALFISEQEQVLYEARAGVEVEDLQKVIHWANNQPPYERYHFYDPGGGSSEAEEPIYPVHYLRQDPMEMTEYRYFYQHIPIETMVSHLFVDPTLLQQIDDREGTFYTDGTRGLQDYENNLTMHFFHPQVDTSEEDEGERSYVERGVQFINQHEGWDAAYMLDDVEQLEQQKNVLFRQFLNDERMYFPVYAAGRDEERHLIQLQMQGEAVIGYQRPLFETDQVMSESTIALPTGERLLQLLEEEEVDLADIQMIETGYKTHLTETYIHYEPQWVIHFQTGQPMFISVEEVFGGLQP